MHQKMKRFLSQRITAIAIILFSGALYYISNGLNGNYWFLLWVAPLPIFSILLHSSTKQTFFISFLAYLIGRLSWFTYLVTVATLIPAVVFTITLSLIFALIMVITRMVVVKINTWYGVFAFPVFFTAFEWLMLTFSPDGTAASIAYSQSNAVSLIQIASVTGILGVTFMVTFIPSAIAMGWYFRKEKKKLLPLASVVLFVTVSVLLFGFIRINSVPKSDTITVGLVVLDEKTHKMGNINFQNEIEHTRRYASEISKLSILGAKLVLLPERAININNTTDSTSINIISTCAKQHQVDIVSGFTNLRDEKKHNSALAINEQGSITMEYDKRHLVKGLEDEFAKGHQLGLFSFQNLQLGTAICKDLDFPEYIKQYGKNRTVILCVPAWDFVVDDWLHSRMAIMRGIENGFSVLRTARLGRLTISDPYGRVNAEANCSNGKATNLVGEISLNRMDTLYTQYGDWFGLVVIISAIGFLLLITIKPKVK